MNLRTITTLALLALWPATGLTKDGRYVPSPEAVLPYEQLPENAKQKQRAHYEDLQPADEPPYPLEGMQVIHRAMFKLLPRLELIGSLFAVVQVDADGHATSVTFHEMPSNGPNTSAQQVRDVFSLILLQPRYKPAKCGGEPCAMAFLLSADFSRQVVPP